MAHNYCPEIYMWEAVGLKNKQTNKQKTKQKNNWKITFFSWICEIWDKFLKIRYFVNNCFINVQIIREFLCTHVKCGYLPHSKFRFYLIDFFSPNFVYFHLTWLKNRFLKKMLNKEQTPIAFSSQNFELK